MSAHEGGLAGTVHSLTPLAVGIGALVVGWPILKSVIPDIQGLVHGTLANATGQAAPANSGNTTAAAAPVTVTITNPTTSGTFTPTAAQSAQIRQLAQQFSAPGGPASGGVDEQDITTIFATNGNQWPGWDAITVATWMKGQGECSHWYPFRTASGTVLGGDDIKNALRGANVDLNPPAMHNTWALITAYNSIAQPKDIISICGPL